MQSFLGLARCYRRFVDDFSKIAAPIIAFIRKNVKFEWTDAYERSSQELKRQFETIPILTIPEGEDGLVIYCEASNQGLRAVLMWYGRMIACASHQLKDFEKNYLTHDLELVAVMFTLKIWRY